MSDCKILTADDVRTMLREACEAAGGLTKWAVAHNMSAPMPGMFINGKRPLTYPIERGLGLKRVWMVDDDETRR